MNYTDTRKVWLVAHPTHQYNEDVKQLARQNNLKIYDTKVAGDFDSSRVEQNPPKLTKPGDKPKAKPGPKAKTKPAEPESEEQQSSE